VSIDDSARSQDIEKLRERHRALEREKITAEANLNTSTTTLENLKKQARESYGTDDLRELRAKLEAMKAENEQKRADYQRHLDEIERQLKDVEQQHTETAQRGLQP
jgi:hypothetical protein